MGLRKQPNKYNLQLIGTKLPRGIVDRLMRLSAKNKLYKIHPYTIRDIMREAVEDYLLQHEEPEEPKEE